MVSAEEFEIWASYFIFQKKHLVNMSLPYLEEMNPNRRETFAVKISWKWMPYILDAAVSTFIKICMTQAIKQFFFLSMGKFFEPLYNL